MYRDPFENPSYVTAEIYESPKEIPDMSFAVNNPGRGGEWLAKLKADGAHQIDTYKEVPIYSSGNYIYTEQDGALTYFVKWEDRPMPGKRGKYVTQIAIERSPSRGEIGLVSYVFWNHLLKMHGAIMTDNAQTRLGKQFWGRQVHRAFVENHTYVYYVDLSDNSYSRLNDIGEYEKAMERAYGKDNQHRQRRILITNYPLE
jgi:hypothetical protein